MPQATAAEEGTAGALVGARNHVWTILGIVLIIGGITASIFAASGAARNAHQRAERGFLVSSSQIAMTLQLTLEHANDLVASERALILGSEHPSEAAFAQWAVNVDAMARYPALLGFGEVQVFTPSQLPTFAARPPIRSARGPAPHGPFEVVPAGDRSQYCLTSVGFERTAGVLPTGYDFCSGAQGALMLEARDSGRVDLQPITVGGSTVLSLADPVYRGGAVPPTISGRRSAFVGWVGMAIEPRILLDTALNGHPRTAVILSFPMSDGRVARFDSGTIPAGGHTTSIHIPEGWTVQTFAPVNDQGWLLNPTARPTLLLGIALSLVVGALFFLLDRVRSRAVAMADQRSNELRFMALHDALTGLPNRVLILDRIEQMLGRSLRNNLPVAVVVLGLDDFKDVNDTLGPTAGDQILVAVAARLAAALRKGDTVGRLSGDEFVLLVEGDSPAADIAAVADRLREVLGAPFRIQASAAALSIGSSVGVAVGDRHTAEELLRDASIALSRAKAAGKRRAVVFAPEMQATARLHRQMAVDLKGALEADQFFLVYQPTFRLADNALTGVEALLRWRHPDHGDVLPDDFIPELEATGLIVPVGAWVLDTACRQCAAWYGRGHRFSLSVNLSVKQLERTRVVDDVRSALVGSGLDPTSLTLELTETALMTDVSESVARLGVLKSLGVRLAIDDFGTGYSSLAYLRRFPVDILKIDRSFVAGIATSTESAVLVHTLVQLGQALELETVAEGIEDDSQRALLQGEHVDHGQGMLFSRPLGVADLERFLEDFDPRTGRPQRPGGARAIEITARRG